MTEHKTFPGKTYCVTCAEGCTVTDSTGALSMECEAGKQLHVTAPSDKLFTSASAIVREVFKLAPAKLKALGLIGGGELYPGFDLKKYAACKTVDDVIAINANYITDLTDDGVWPYPMPEMTSFPNMHNSWWYGFFKGSKIKKIKAKYPKCTYAQAMLGSVTTVEEVDLTFPIATHVSTTCENCDALRKVRIIAPKATRFDNNVKTHKANKLAKCELYAPEATNIEYLVTGAGTLEEVSGEFGAKATNLNNAFANCPKLKVFPTNYPKASTASGMFSSCQIPGEAAIAVLNSLPAYTSGTHSITMGIHKDFESDADVLSAIENAEAKGWTVPVQWNGTATVQTATTWGLRRPIIYAKVREVEQPDGVTVRELDWGHYVTNAEENGYRAFSSVEEAEEELLNEQ